MQSTSENKAIGGAQCGLRNSHMKHLGFVVVTLPLSVDCVAHSDFCETMNAAMRALPVGGVVDETSATGAKTCFSDCSPTSMCQ